MNRGLANKLGDWFKKATVPNYMQLTEGLFVSDLPTYIRLLFTMLVESENDAEFDNILKELLLIKNKVIELDFSEIVNSSVNEELDYYNTMNILKAQAKKWMSYTN